MPAPVIACFCMGDRGHVQRILTLVADLSAAGARVHVFTERQFAAEIVQAGGRFDDLFANRSVDDADAESWPIPVRYATFAGRFADEIAEATAAVQPSLIVYDTFAVVGQAMAARLRLPSVNVCAGHAVVPERFLTVLREHPRVHVSAACLAAVDRLQSRDGLAGASPFSYVTGLSATLNVYCEPPQFLVEADRVAFEPVAFYGSLTTIGDEARPARGDGGAAQDGPLALYVSFGTQIWDYRETEALAAIAAVSEAAASHTDLSVLVSLGGKWRSGVDRARLPPNVRVAPYVDQAAALRDAGVFLTHHGLNSTHEAIALGVPMLSYPFVWDQPGLAAICQRLGLAVALAPVPMAHITAADVLEALDQVHRSRRVMAAALAEAAAWERAVIAGRPEVVARIIALARQHS